MKRASKLACLYLKKKIEALEEIERGRSRIKSFDLFLNSACSYNNGT